MRSGFVTTFQRFSAWLVAGAIVLGALAGLIYLIADALFTHNADFRRWYNVVRAQPYRYEGIQPVYLETDPASLIALPDAEAVAAKRAAVTRAVFGRPDLPREARPDVIERAIDPRGVAALAPYGDPAVVATVDRLSVIVDEAFTAKAYLLHPLRPNGRLFAYQQGYAGTIDKAAGLLRPLLERGYTVLALNYVGYGESAVHRRLYPGHGVFVPGREHFLFDPLPLRRYLLPMVAGLNQAMEDLGVGQADLGGISAGGWVTVVTAAMDERIRRSYPMAGAYPLYLQQLDHHPPTEEQYYPPLVQAADYLELFVLGAVGRGRGQVQFFGQYDRCCQNNRLSELYAPAVRAAVDRLGGFFYTHINDKSPDHRINEDYIALILGDLDALDK
ncbi:alpha/beta hydrolase [Rhodospirillum rubrum]|uniref:alpha/beta fold hydrolase n=1 Tax=Rhodospirillum rubrum TaxID=1085 RepID=UPI0019078B8D|nr:alpha/beta fold hydrolase [Rhodospirillum rubrum]MBK1664583.1 alpha/beta hydrolase [Rhodospirillum rubrum]MBK1676754.1 alpha/beta hydrolase [Rhodospirillum rubrum]